MAVGLWVNLVSFERKKLVILFSAVCFRDRKGQGLSKYLIGVDFKTPRANQAAECLMMSRIWETFCLLAEENQTCTP
jgi:hypothetical protein